MKIDERDVLQVNATIMAGILIFLTVSVVSEPISLSDPGFKLGFKMFVRYAIMLTLVPFSFSIVVILRDKEPEHGNRLANAKRLTIWGIMLLFVSTAIMLIPFTFE